MVEIVDEVNGWSTWVDPVDLKSTLSTKVDQKAKGRFIQKASEEGLTPSEALRRLVDVYIKGGPIRSGNSRELEKLVAFVHGVGRHRMEDCKHARKSTTGELMCWYWHFDDDDRSAKNLETYPIDGEDYMCAEVDPIMCGACHAYKREE